MQTLNHLFENNRRWADSMCQDDPDFFSRLSRQQKPAYLWIGCSDSRVPANQIIGLAPGEVFVHRNIANLVVHTDINCLSVIEYAVNVLQVRHVIVCGHYGCGGVQASMGTDRLGLIDNWLRHIRDVQQRHAAQLDQLDGNGQRFLRLCELNVMEQVRNVCYTSIVQAAWDRDQDLTVHGLIYGLDTGLLKNLGVSGSTSGELEVAYGRALDELSVA